MCYLQTFHDPLERRIAHEIKKRQQPKIALPAAATDTTEEVGMTQHKQKGKS